MIPCSPRFRRFVIVLSVSTVLAISTVFVGCAGKAVDVRVSPDHPANPNAAQAIFEMPPNVLTQESAEASTSEAASPPSRSGLALTEQAETALTELLDAYFTIGTRLASDSLEDVAPYAEQMAEALPSLTQATPPDAPHFWHQRSQEVDVIREQAGVLTLTSELDTARTAYAFLSDALRQLLVTLGIPAEYGKPVVGFVCGMFPDVPENGLWMQIGDEVRNPYFGSAIF